MRLGPCSSNTLVLDWQLLCERVWFAMVLHWWCKTLSAAVLYRDARCWMLSLMGRTPPCSHLSIFCFMIPCVSLIYDLPRYHFFFLCYRSICWVYLYICWYWSVYFLVYNLFITFFKTYNAVFNGGVVALCLPGCDIACSVFVYQKV